MSEIPPGMHQQGRPPIPHFHKEETLFRRVPPIFWVDEAEGLPFEDDAIDLPDMSVGRSLFAHPEWLRLASGCEAWGVIGFQVQDVPLEQWLDGLRYAFKIEHAPEPRKYSHSEVRVHEPASGSHIASREALPYEVQLRWRNRLLRTVQVFLRCREAAKIRQHPPTSHKIEKAPPSGSEEV